ncbi:hypothetical protein NPIL_369241 [Nephila pilipes]|uniref:Methyltransferase type 11 domain-containing protein n=1 Tax=Nephila pilipes TaxID=299642 RepID=A0A8X6UFY7_NEPPI|nr:hypothetical protein NPIL_369241 [Nephila pilipes]
MTDKKKSKIEVNKMNLNSDLYSIKPIPFPSVKRFFKETLPQLGWNKNDENEVGFDAGCGPGGTTVEWILPLLPKLKILYAVDILSNMIELAQKQNFHPKIEYSVANMEDWSTIKHWKGQITKLVSVYSLQWLKDQRQGFQNVYQLLKAGGEAAILYVMESPLFPTLVEMQNKPKWNKFFKGIDLHISDAYHKKFNASYYKEILKEIGFDILYCKEEMTDDVFISEKQYKDFFTSICVLKSHVPENMEEEFEEEFFEAMDKYNGRNANESPVHRGKILELLIRKPDNTRI